MTTNTNAALTEDQWLGLADLHANADWNCEKPDGFLNAVKALCADFAALTTAAAVPPEGWVMVPVEATVSMREAMQRGTGMSFSETKIAYNSMLAAAPKAEPVPAGEYPTLPEPDYMPEFGCPAFGAEKMHAYGEACWKHAYKHAAWAQAAPAAVAHIQQPFTLAEIKAKIASNDYSAELMLQHAMLLLEKPVAVAGPSRDLHPEKCPITGRPFFMVLDHPELGPVPTYGGPFDSYTIPAPEGEPTDPWHERELRCERFDHDAGYWVEGGEPIPLRIVHDDVLDQLQSDAAAPTAKAAPQLALWDEKKAVELFESVRAGSNRPAGVLRGIRAVIAAWEGAQPAAPQEDAHNFAICQHFDNWLLSMGAYVTSHSEDADGPLAPAMNWIASVKALIEQAQQAVPAAPQGNGGTAIGHLGQRTIFDAIRAAYDLGYSDARNSRTIPGDSAPGYKGRNVEVDHGGALIARLNVLASRHQQAAPVAQGDVRAEQALRKILEAIRRYLPPDGPSAHDTLTEIIGVVDPWPLDDPKGPA